MVVTGEGYCAALEQFLALGLPITSRCATLIVSGDIALLVYDGSINGTDRQGNAVDLSGSTADVARNSTGGRRFVIDDPFGTA